MTAVQPSEATAVADSDARYQSAAYRWYTVFVFMLIYACHSLDRGIPNIVVEPVRLEFGLSDSQLGLFTGLAFGIAFAVMGLPLGYLADRVNRRNMLAAIVALWSVATALGGVARGFVFLVLTRLGVGAAEAGAAPLALPMISDIFPANRRAWAIGIFYMSVPIGTFLANIAGGFVAQEFGWRMAFLLGGVPGLFLAILLMLTVTEPRRGMSDASTADAGTDQDAAGWREIVGFFVTSPGLLVLMLGCAFMGLVNIAAGAWIGSFFIRLHGVTLGQVGLILGVGGGLCGMASTASMGWLTDRLAPRDPRWSLWLVALSALAAIVFSIPMLFLANTALAIGAYFIVSVFTHGYPPPSYSVLMGRTPARMRSTIMSLLQLTTNLIGFGLGPILIGFMSDLYGGGEALRYALATALIFNVIVIVFFLVASRSLFGKRSRSQESV